MALKTLGTPSFKRVLNKVQARDKRVIDRAICDHGVITDCYKHIYETRCNADLDIDSVKRFLTGR